MMSLLVAGISGLALFELKKTDASYSDLVNRREIILSNSKDMRASTLQQMSSLRDYLLTQSQDGLTRYKQANADLTDAIDKTLPLVHRDEDKEALNKLKELNSLLKANADQAIALAGADKSEAVQSAVSKAIPIGRTMEEISKQIADGQQKLVADTSAATTVMVDSIRSTVLTLSIASVVLAISVGLIIAHRISKPVALVANAAKRVAAGDLTQEQITVRSGDEVGDLARSFNEMAAGLRGMIRQVRNCSEHVAASSQELTAGASQTRFASEQIASTVQEVVIVLDKQAESVEESVRAMNEMSAGIEEVAGKAQTASSLSVQAARKTLEGNEAVNQAKVQMESIQASFNRLAGDIREMGERSGEVGQIVTFISDIAAQTNLLALNAAIEAARAGEQGRGFAVVANEVRKLAEQSSRSAEQIAQLISHIQTDVGKTVRTMTSGAKEIDEGILVVNAVGEVFEDINQVVERVSYQVQDVSAASEQMSAGAEQLLATFDEISAGAKHAASESQTVSSSTEEQLASMEEIAASAASLSDIAAELQLLIGKFKL
jgi:methyl-accepting chemotaxis protein